MTLETIGRVVVALLLATMASCSILLGGDDDPVVDAGAPDAPAPPADCPEATTAQTFEIFEGQGETSHGVGLTAVEWESSPRLVHVFGTNLPTGNTPVFFSKAGAVDVVGGTFNGEIGVLQVVFPIDLGRNDGSEDAFLFAFNNDEGTCVRVALTATYLPQLVASEFGVGDTFEPRYSFISLVALGTGKETAAIELNSTSAIVVGGMFNLSGDLAGPGPGGESGGIVRGDGELGDSGGRGSESRRGGGGGHAFVGGTGTDGEDAAGGVAAGDITLLRASDTVSRGGNGGGGSPTGRGGHGGGALFARAEAAFVPSRALTSDTLVSATGEGDSIPQNLTAPGGGAGGTVYLAAPRIPSDLRMFIDVSGGQTSDDNDGSGGRVRIDSPSLGQITHINTETSSFWRGAGLVASTEISRTGSSILTAYGGDGMEPTSGGHVTVVGVVSVRSRSVALDEERVVVPPRTSIVGDVSVSLDPGVNIVCIDTLGGTVADPQEAIIEDATIASNCVEVGYVPTRDDSE